MNNITNEIKMKKQQIIIVNISIFLSIIISLFIGFLVYNKTQNNSIDIFIKSNYNQGWATCYDIEITCQVNTKINVNDFTYLYNDQEFIINKIVMNDKEYVKDESFIINQNQINQLTIYALSWVITETSVEIYYKSNKINFGERNHFIT